MYALRKRMKYIKHKKLKLNKEIIFSYDCTKSITIILSISKLKVILGHYSIFFRYKALKNLWNLFKIILLKKGNLWQKNCTSLLLVRALGGSLYTFSRPLGNLVVSYVFWYAESIFQGYQAEKWSGYLLLTFFINN